jgi:FKBP-type peptidyl-prolyl cis-trans isomerase (trigger factor)
MNLPLKNKTRKVSKKIKFSLKHLNKKIHKAKTIKKQSEEKSLEEIKKLLSDAKLIKVDSKAPEAMIRQIYSDFMVLKHKAL